MTDMPNEDELEAAMIWAAEQRRSVGFTITPIYGGGPGQVLKGGAYGGSGGGGVTVNIGEAMRPPQRPVSDPQTVREAFDAQMDAIYYDDPPYECSQVYSERIDFEALGIDPDMPLEALKRRLLWGERVDALYAAANESGNWVVGSLSQDDSNVVWDLLDNLTREEA